MGQAGGMGQLPGQREGLPAPPQGLIGIAQHPQALGRKAQAAHARVMAAVEKGVRPVLPGVIESDPLLQVCPGRRPISDEGIGRSQRVMRLQEERRILPRVGPGRAAALPDSALSGSPRARCGRATVPTTPGRAPAILPTHRTERARGCRPSQRRAPSSPWWQTGRGPR